MTTLTKDEIIELARKCGIYLHVSPRATDLHVSPRTADLQDFAHACIARGAAQREKELLAVGMEPVHFIMVQGKCIGYFSSDQLAAARLQGAAERERELPEPFYQSANGEDLEFYDVDTAERIAAACPHCGKPAPDFPQLFKEKV